MTTRIQKPNRFLRPKRDRLTTLEKVKANLRSLVFIGGTVAAAGFSLSYLARNPDDPWKEAEANRQWFRQLKDAQKRQDNEAIYEAEREKEYAKIRAEEATFKREEKAFEAKRAKEKQEYEAFLNGRTVE